MKNDFDELILLATNKVGLLNKAGELSLMQQKYIMENDFQELILSLEERLKVLDEIMSVENSIKASYKKVKHYFIDKSRNYEYEIGNFNDLKKKADELLKQIVETNIINETALIEKMDQLKVNLRDISNNKKSLSAYSIMDSSSNGIYFDKTK